MLRDLTVNGTETILLGDFNFDYSTPNPATKNFRQITSLFHLKQIITEPTRITDRSRTLIDLFPTSRPELYLSGVIPVGFPDHCAIFGVRKLHIVKLQPPRFVDIRNYKNFDPKLFRNDLSHIPWNILELNETTDGAWNSFKTCFSQ